MKESTHAAMTYARAHTEELGFLKISSTNGSSCAFASRSYPERWASAGVTISTALLV